MLMPAQVEKRLRELEQALDEAHADLVAAEDEFQQSKADHEIGMARARLELARQPGKSTVQERDDQALLLNESNYRRLLTSEAWVKGSRANVSRLRTQVDITRSLGTGLRAAMDL